jgi:hypothetical protein
MRHWWTTLALRALGAIWLAAWVSVLVFLLDLWSRLGGLVDERLRWWARLGLTAGPVIGYTAGLRAREMARWGSGCSHASLLRLFWLPPAVLVCALMLKMTLTGGHDEARATLGAFCAYWAGFDAAIAAWPLACGRPYRFAKDIPPEEPWEPSDGDQDGPGWV